MPAFSMQKQSSRNLVLSPNAQIAYGGILAEAKLTIRQRFDPSSVFEKTPSRRTDYNTVGKGSEWATNDQATAWDIKGTLKSEADSQLLGWILAFVFGQETVTGAAAPYTHTFTVPNISATMPCTTVEVVLMPMERVSRLTDMPMRQPMTAMNSANTGALAMPMT